MEVKELRLGNYVKFLDSDIYRQVLEIYKNFIGVSSQHKNFSLDVNLKDIEGIPLTEEWLINFGFIFYDKTISLNYGGESMRYALLKDFILYFHGENGYNLETGWRRTDFCIKYVHQLQNLYFAITGKELNLKNNL